MATVRQTFGLNDMNPYKITGLSAITPKNVIKSAEMVGIEVEIENVRLENNPNKVWSVTEDGSLRNNGRELITRPIMAESAPLALEYLFETYLPKQWCFSPRTSVHVHLNMLDMDMAQVTNLVLLYTIFEKLFYRFAGRGRNKNIYCVPLTDTDLLVNLVNKTISGDTWSKYTGLNLLPLINQGTVEFRHMHGTADVEKLSIWIGLICKLKEFVKNTKTATIRADIANMGDDYNFALLTDNVFQELAVYMLPKSQHDLSYLAAKQALVPQSNTATLRATATSNSPFFNFKEK